MKDQDLFVGGKKGSTERYLEGGRQKILDRRDGGFLKII